MTAPEDPNGLREALARWLGREENDKDAFLRIAERIGIDSEYRCSSDPELRQGSLVELLERHAGPLASLIAERDEALSASRLSDRIAKAHADRATAAEAEITRLKEGMEKIAGFPKDYDKDGQSWGVGYAFYAVQNIARATLSPKEQP